MLAGRIGERKETLMYLEAKRFRMRRHGSAGRFGYAVTLVLLAGLSALQVGCAFAQPQQDLHRCDRMVTLTEKAKCRVVVENDGRTDRDTGAAAPTSPGLPGPAPGPGT